MNHFSADFQSLNRNLTIIERMAESGGEPYRTAWLPEGVKMCRRMFNALCADTNTLHELCLRIEKLEKLFGIESPCMVVSLRDDDSDKCSAQSKMLLHIWLRPKLLKGKKPLKWKQEL